MYTDSLKFKHEAKSAIRKLVLPVETFNVFIGWLEPNQDLHTRHRQTELKQIILMLGF